MASYRVLRGNPRWPTVASLALIRKRGGIRALSQEEQDGLDLHISKDGEIVDDIPKESIPWMLEQGLIEPAVKKAARRK